MLGKRDISEPRSGTTVEKLLTLDLEQNRPLLLAVIEELSNSELKRTLKRW
jgi:hypothetical protein